MSTPIYHQPDPADLQAAERSNVRGVTRRTTAAAARPAAAPVERSAPAVATATPRAEAPAAAPIPAPIAAAPATRPTAQAATTANDDVLPIAGAGAAALVLLGAGAVLFHRRRREEEGADDVAAERTEEVGLTETTLAAPILAREPIAPRTDRGTSTLPSGFDLSRYGRHTQAAYRGPTAENPSQSLRTRLKRASFFDGRERMATEGGSARPATPIAAAARTESAPARTDGQIVIRQRTAKPRDFFRPAFSSPAFSS